MIPAQAGIGLDNARDGYRCGQAVARQALAAFQNTPPQLALLFTAHTDPRGVLKGVNDALGDVPLVGATSAGVYSHQSYLDEGAGLMLLHGDYMRIAPLVHKPGFFGLGQRVLGNRLEGLSRSGLGSTYGYRALMLFPDEGLMDLNQLMDRAMTETAMLYDIVGGPGLGRQPTPEHRAAVFHNQQLIHRGVAGAEILSQHALGMALSNGWQPVGGPYRVTEAGNSRIHKIDGRPAWEVYAEFLQSQLHNPRLVADQQAIAPYFLKYAIGACNEQDCRVCLVKEVADDGALIVTAAPPTGSLVNILTTQPDAMIAAARQAVRQARQGLGAASPAAMLFIDCMSTGMALGEAYEKQRVAVEEQIGAVPFLGFRSYGVLARLSGQTAGHYACSVAACMLPQPAS